VLPDKEGIGAIFRAVFGYQDEPSVLEFAAWLAYLLVTGFLFFRPAAPVPRRVAVAAESR
jgi:high-affinity iron transporter